MRFWRAPHDENPRILEQCAALSSSSPIFDWRDFSIIGNLEVTEMSVMQAFLLWRRFERQQWLPRRQLERAQHDRVRMMLRWAGDTVPYYHELFRELQCKFSELPVLRKEDVQEFGKELRSVRIPENRMTYGATTGSTGIPLTIGHDELSRAAGWAVMLRAYRAHGLNMTDTLLRITHRRRKRMPHEHLGILPIRTVSVYAPPEQLVQSMHKTKPDAIDAYPSVLQAMAEHTPPHLERIFSTTEMLIPAARKRIERAFGAQVIDLYGAAEFPRLAWECPAGGGYHVDSDYALVECLADGEPAQPGERGELVVTGLYNYGMPLIRYAIGDTAVMGEEECTCGRGLPLLASIEGRSDDALVMPDGERVSPRRINVLDGLSGVRHYRIVQSRADLIVAEIVPIGHWTVAQEAAVVARIKQGLGSHAVHVRVKIVPAIPRGPGGKIRTVVSHVRP